MRHGDTGATCCERSGSMKRRLFNILAAMSLFLAVLTAMMWVRSYFWVDIGSVPVGSGFRAGGNAYNGELWLGVAKNSRKGLIWMRSPRAQQATPLSWRGMVSFGFATSSDSVTIHFPHWTLTM